MHNFFVDKDARQGNKYMISDDNHKHIKNVLRMTEGDTFLVSCEGKSDLCKIESTDKDSTVALIIQENYQSTELPVKIYLFQGLPKSDKMELIIQKAVELGVHEILPTEMSRCVMKLDEKKKKSKRERWQAISESAAKQSKRNIIPQIHSVISYGEALNLAEKLDLIIVPYENEKGMQATKQALEKIGTCATVGIFIGPEGGFEEAEIEKIKSIGGEPISLGNRILRTETAAITAVGICMLYIETR